MKKLFLALGLVLFIGGSEALAGEIVNYTQVQPVINAEGKEVIQMPDRKSTLRRRMLFDFGLFGAGIHVGWLKPKNAACSPMTLSAARKARSY